MIFRRREKTEESYLEKRERVRLSQGILAELQKQEQLRKDILDSVGRSSKDTSFWRQPVVLLVVGFLLTGGLGGFLSSCWQSSEWTRQQNFLNQQRSLEQKSLVANDTAKAIGEMQSSMASVLIALQRDDDETCESELNRALPGWKQSKLDWQVKAYVLSSRLLINFPPGTMSPPNQEVGARFQEIVKCYKTLNTGLDNMTEAVARSKGMREQAIVDDRDSISTVLNATVNRRMTAELMNLMAQQMRAADTTPSPLLQSLSSSSQAMPAGSPIPPDPCPFTVREYGN